ncbi:MAG: hypothetical protein IJ736_10220 [Firmicutes bacterium]|nr:hypothetical protein [Bacillota bacterium]
MTYRQKNLLRRVVSFICALAMMLSMLSFSVIADEGTYTINGYSKQNIIEDSSGNTIPGFAFCLDSKLHTPFKSNPEAIFTRVKLSEIDEYEKYYVDDNNVTHTLIKTFDDVKRTRLLKLLVFYSDIRKWARANVRTYPDKEWLLENIDSLNTTSSLVRSSWSELSESDRMKKIEDQLDSNWSSFITNPELVQRLIWTVVYEDEYWPEFVEDDGTTTGKSDNYKIREKYFYISSDPYNDEHSLWNIAYVPFLEYIDSIDDSAVENYDAWVYVTEADDVQSMLGAAFLISEEEDKTYISKTDIAGSGEVKGAVLKLSGRDRDNKSIIFSERQKKQLEDFSGELLEGEKVLSWTSGLSSAVIGGLPDGTYILHEESAPNGY